MPTFDCKKKKEKNDVQIQDTILFTGQHGLLRFRVSIPTLAILCGVCIFLCFHQALYFQPKSSKHAQ